MAVSAGARSRATSTNGCPGFGTPGGGSLSRCAITRCEMSSRSAARSAMYPPMPASRSRYAANASYTARSAVLPVARSFVTSSIRLGSSAIIAWASSTSFAAPPGLRPAVRELGRDDRQRRPGALALTLGIEVAGPIDRFGQRIGHPNDRPHCDTLSDARAPDLHHSPSRFG